jgi:hypothetical protein
LDLDFNARDFAKFKRAIHDDPAERGRICPALSGSSRFQTNIRAHGSKLTLVKPGLSLTAWPRILQHDSEKSQTIRTTSCVSL